jgi:hypothetical protein
MHPGLCAGIDPDMKMKQVRVDGRRYVPCPWKPHRGAIMSGPPDWHAALFTPLPLKVVHETPALSGTALFAVKGLV